MKVDVFIPCLADQFKPETAGNLYKVLRHLGVEMIYPESQTCCGLMAYNEGHWDEVKIIGEKFINEFNSDRYIVVPSAACANMVRNNYSRFFYNTSLHLEYKKLQSRVFELSDFLINVLHISAWKGKYKAHVFFHADSNAYYDYGITEEPLRLLSMIEGLTIVSDEKNDSECGFGGSFALSYSQLSSSMALELLQSAKHAGADTIVSLETSCLIQLESVALKNDISIKIMTLADLLAESLRFSDAVFTDDPQMTLG